jgi:hypothetical protein
MQMKLTGIAMALAFAFATAAQAQSTQTPAKRDASQPRAEQSNRKAKDADEDRIEQEYKAAREKCNAMKGNEKDICMAEAKGQQKVAKAELDAKNAKDQTKAQRKVQDAKADAAYDVAKEKCDVQKGEAKDACMKQARVERDKLKGKAERTAEAKQERKAAAGSTAPKREKREAEPKRTQ